MKQYLYYTQHETTTTGKPVTTLYLSPKEFYANNGTYPDNYDRADREMLRLLKPLLGLKEEAEWAFSTTDYTPPEIIAFLSSEQYRKHFSTTDKFAQQMKDEAMA